MFGLRQALRASLRLFPVKSLEKVPIFLENSSRTLLQAIGNEGILQRFSTQVNESTKEQKMEGERLTKHPVDKLEAKLKIMFTCKKCDTRNTKTMTKLAYQKGVVIIRCDGCKNNHLIADNLGWFGPIEAKRNIEKIMKLKGETVRRLQDYGSATFEVISKDEEIEIKREEVVEVEEGKPLQIDR